MSTPALTQALLVVAGLGLALGLNLVIWFAPHQAYRVFSHRVEPYCCGGANTAANPAQWLRRTPRKCNTAWRWMGLDEQTLEQKIMYSGTSLSPVILRQQFLLSALAAMLAAVAVNLIFVSLGVQQPGFFLLSVLAAAAAGFLGRGVVLNAKIQRREKMLIAEFPDVAELIALAVGAGDTAASAVQRVQHHCGGALAEEFSRLSADINSGMSLSQGFNRLAQRVPVNCIQRFVEAVLVAVERGTPLAEVVRAQAQDARDAAKRELMETAGRKEIAMLVPVVFGIMPLTVIFAIYPGLALLNLTIG